MSITYALQIYGEVSAVHAAKTEHWKLLFNSEDINYPQVTRYRCRSPRLQDGDTRCHEYASSTSDDFCALFPGNKRNVQTGLKFTIQQFFGNQKSDLCGQEIRVLRNFSPTPDWVCERHWAASQQMQWWQVPISTMKCWSNLTIVWQKVSGQYHALQKVGVCILCPLWMRSTCIGKKNKCLWILIAKYSFQ